MKRILGAAVAILATLATVALLAGLMMSFNHGGKDPDRKAQGSSRPSAPESMGVAVELPQAKQFPLVYDPVDGIKDLASCRSAHGEWAEGYKLGELVGREPLKGAVRVGMRCWSLRKPASLADAGKACRGQADCIGNCIALPLADGKWSGPICQAYAQPSTCGPIFDRGRYHMIPCQISF